MDPQQRHVAEVFDGYRETYSESVDRAVAFSGLSADFFTRVKAGYISDLVKQHYGIDRSVAALDIGCGVGNYHSLLRPIFSVLSGVDVSEACINKARENNAGVDYSTYDGKNLPYGSGSFDVAFTICVLHHVPPVQWNNFISEMRRVLRPGGIALVFEHNPINPLTMRVVNNCPFDEDATLLRSVETEGLLKQAGFSKIGTRFILSVPANGQIGRQVDRLFSRLRVGAQYYVSGTA